jgi:hypothetical protein
VLFAQTRPTAHLTVEADCPWIRATVTGTERLPFSLRHKIEVIAQPTRDGDQKGRLWLTTPEAPGHVLEVPVHVDGGSQFTIVPADIFAVCSSTDPFVRGVVVSGTEPFTLVRVSVRAPWLGVKAEQTEAEPRSCRLTVTVFPARFPREPAKRIWESSITVAVNAEGPREMVLPCYVHLLGEEGHSPQPTHD